MDEPISRAKQCRGRLAVGVRRRLTQPLARRLPLSTLRRYHRLRRRVAPGRYTDADPTKIIEIDPDRLTHSLLESIPPYPQLGRVVDGQWDRDAERFADRAVVRAIRQRFDEGLPWRETALFDAYLDQLERFGNAWGYRSLGDFETRTSEVDALYQSIREQGYRRQYELEPSLQRDSVAALISEINVDVGPDGELYWRSYGQHRLAIAQLLGIERVPVVVHRRHRRWQAVRDRLREGGRALDPAYRDHPDLRPLLDTDSTAQKT